jgi:hypothetical protein
MRLFKGMNDPVRGKAKVAYSSVLPGLSSSVLRLVITADGVPPTPVEFKPRPFRPQRGNRWPQEGDTIPVTVDRANPENFKIEWSEVQKVADRLRQREERATHDALAEAQEEARGRSRRAPKHMNREDER